MRPDVSPRATNVFVALLVVYERDGRATVRSVADEAEIGIATAHTYLATLASHGLISVGVRGGLRPLVKRVA